MNLLTAASAIPIIDINPYEYTLGITPGENQLYEITSLQILQPDGNYSLENTTWITIGGKIKPLTLSLHDKILVSIANISSTDILISEQYQLGNGSTITSDPYYQDLSKFKFDCYVMTTNTSLIGEVTEQANIDTTTLSSSAVYFEDYTTLSNVTGLTKGWGSRYELPSGWLKSIIYETYNDTHHPISYYQLEQYVEPEPTDPFEVNPTHNTIGVGVGDEQVLEMIAVTTPEPTDWQIGDQFRLIILSLTPDTIRMSQEHLDTFGNLIDEFELDVNRSSLNPLNFLLTTNVTLIHEVFDTNPDFNTSYTNEFVTLNHTMSILTSTISFDIIYDLQTGWMVSYHIKVGSAAELTELWMVAISTMTTASTTTDTVQTTTEDPGTNTSTTTSTTPEISPFSAMFMIMGTIFIIGINRKKEKLQ